MISDMGKERLMQLVLFVSLIFLILLSFLIGITFGQFYMVLFFILIICGIFFILIELYLRVQHNINRKSNNLQKDMNNLQKDTNSIGENLHNRFESLKNQMDEINNVEINRILSELVGFNEALLQYFEDDKKERIDNFCQLQGNFKDNLESSNDIKNFQNKLVVLNQQILEYQKDQTNFLKAEVRKLKNGSRTRRKK